VGVGGAIQNSLQGLVGDGPDSVRIGAIAAFGGLAALLATYCLWLMQRSVAKARSPNRAGPCLYASAGAGWGGWGGWDRAALVVGLLVPREISA